MATSSVNESFLCADDFDNFAMACPELDQAEADPSEVTEEVSVDRDSMPRRSALRGSNSQVARKMFSIELLMVMFSSYDNRVGHGGGFHVWDSCIVPLGGGTPWIDDRHVCAV